uniref:Uncharacterized protein n=1 Tax=Sipha flava TaxID=143950 RepID=A0A2S2PY56_9HEMI
MFSAQKLNKNTRTQAFGLSKTMLSFYFIIALYFMKNIMYKMKVLTEKLEAIELNVIDALMLLNNINDILKEINNDDVGMDNLVENSIQFAYKLGIDPNYDFNRLHRRRLKLNRLDFRARGWPGGPRPPLQILAFSLKNLYLYYTK